MKFRTIRARKNKKMVARLRRLGPIEQIKVLSATDGCNCEWVGGRGSGCHILTCSKYASRKHFSIFYKEKKFWICDHGTLNGTYLNNTKIESGKEYVLTPDSTISVGVPQNIMNYNECILFKFEICEDSTDSGGDNGSESGTNSIPADNNEEINKKSDNKPHTEEVGGKRTSTLILIESQSESAEHIDNPTRDVVNEIRPDRVSFSEETLLSVPGTSAYSYELDNNEPGPSCGGPRNAIMRTTELDDNNLSRNRIIRIPTVVNKDVMNFWPVKFCDDTSHACDALAELKESEKNPSQSYSAMEELTEVSDSEVKILEVAEVERNAESLSTEKLEQDDDECKYEDDVVFLFSIDRNYGDDIPGVTVDNGKLVEVNKNSAYKLQEDVEKSNSCTDTNKESNSVSKSRVIGSTGDGEVQAESEQVADIEKARNQRKTSLKTLSDVINNINISDDDAGRKRDDIIEVKSLKSDEVKSNQKAEDVGRAEISNDDFGSDKKSDYNETTTKTSKDVHKCSKKIKLLKSFGIRVNKNRQMRHSTNILKKKKRKLDVPSNKYGRATEDLTLSKGTLRTPLMDEVSSVGDYISSPNKSEDVTLMKVKPKKKKFKFPSYSDDEGDPHGIAKKKRKLDDTSSELMLKSPNLSRESKCLRESKISLARESPSEKAESFAGAIAGLSASEKEKIKSKRKAKLREITMKKVVEKSKMESLPKALPPLKVKITHKNRSDFLCTQMCDAEVTSGKKSDLLLERSEETAEEAFSKKRNLVDDDQNIGSNIVNGNLREQNSLQRNLFLSNGNSNVQLAAPEARGRGLKSCLKKFTCTFMKRHKPLVARKNVRFAQVTPQNILEYETENRIVREKSYFKQQPHIVQHPGRDRTIRFGDVLSEVCGWDVMWLEESKTAAAEQCPPSFDINSLKNIRNKFAHYEEYIASFIPLLLLELWSMICEKWMLSRNLLRKCSARCLMYSEYKEFKKNGLGVIKCEIVENASNNIFDFLKEGDLVIVQLQMLSEGIQSTSRDEVSHKRSAFKIFGYVHKKSVENIYPQNHQSSGDRTFNREVLAVMKLYILIKLRGEFCFYIGHNIQITVLYHIAPKLAICQAVFSIYKSPLCSAILAPNRPDMSFLPALKNEDIAYKGLLDVTQRELILSLLSSCLYRESSVLQIQGGAGTGKSRAMMAFIVQILSSSAWNRFERPKVLYCSYSNVVVDEMTLSLKTYRECLPQSSRYKLIRYGNLSSIKPAVRDISSVTLALLNEHHAAVLKKMKYYDDKIKELVKDLECSYKFKAEEIEEKSSRLNEYVKSRESLKHSKPFMDDHKPSDEAQFMIIENADIICTTCSLSASNKMLRVFERIKSKSPSRKIICIVDNAMRCSEGETIMPLQLGVTHLILAGDSQQCQPPTKNTEAQKRGITRSMFGRMCTLYDKMKSPTFILKTQFRMGPGIFSVLNKIFYQDLLTDGYRNGRQWDLEEFLFIRDNLVMEAASNASDLRMQNIIGNIMKELLHVLNEGANNCSVGIITCNLELAYKLRTKSKELFGNRNLSDIEINSVEQVEGREFDVVLFLYDIDMNCFSRALVAMTRAKHSLFIITTNFYDETNGLLNKIVEEATRRKVYHLINVELETLRLKRIIRKPSRLGTELLLAESEDVFGLEPVRNYNISTAALQG